MKYFFSPISSVGGHYTPTSYYLLPYGGNAMPIANLMKEVKEIRENPDLSEPYALVHWSSLRSYWVKPADYERLEENYEAFANQETGIIEAGEDFPEDEELWTPTEGKVDVRQIRVTPDCWMVTAQLGTLNVETWTFSRDLTEKHLAFA